MINIYELGGETPYSLTLGGSLLFMGFGNGVIRAMNIDSNEIELTLHRPHHLGIDVAAFEKSSSFVDVLKNHKYINFF